jgi:hypothetical protein
MFTGEIKVADDVVATYTAERGEEVRPGEFIYHCTCEFVGVSGETYSLNINIEHVQGQGTLTLAARILNSAHFQYQPAVSVLP